MKKLILLSILSLPAQADIYDVESFLSKIHVRVGLAYGEHKVNIADATPSKEPAPRLGAWYRFNNVGLRGCDLDLGIDYQFQLTGNVKYSKKEYFVDYTCSLNAFFY